MEQFPEFTLLKVVTRTGVTHQVRVHLAHSGFPVVGDKFYGGKTTFPELQDRFFLHAHRVFIPEIIDREGLSLVAPLPDELQKILIQLRNAGSIRNQ
jgi:23S rRNA-/tRNA-specific pseudouridylate synthase